MGDKKQCSENLTVERMAGLGQSSAIHTYKTNIKQGVASLFVNDGRHWVNRGPSLKSRTALFPSSVQGHNS